MAGGLDSIKFFWAQFQPYSRLCLQLSREQVRAMRARRDNPTQKETETETGTKAARERDQKTEKTACSTMPPPPPRAVQKQSIGSADFHEDSQATRIDGGGAIVNGGNFRSEPSVNNRGGVSESTQPETATTFTVNQSLQEHGDTPGGGEEPVPSVSGSTVGQDYGEESVRGQERGATSQYSFPKSQTRSSASGGPGPTHSSNAEVSGALPTGFFDDSKAGQASKGQNVQNVESEFDAFMEEVKNIGEEATVGRLGEGNEGGGVSGVEPEGGTRAIDYNDFEQL